MNKLLCKIQRLRRSQISNLIKKRIKSFKKLGRKNIEEIYKELCFCTLTANFNAERAIKIQQKIGDGFLKLDEKNLEKNLRKLGHRFPRTRAHYISESRKKIPELKKALTTLKGEALREWLVKNIKGLGMKEASHFLRNIGYDDYAIIDFHIIDLLVSEKLIRRPKTLSRKKYIKIENILRKIASELNISLAELDLFLWYIETEKILK